MKDLIAKLEAAAEGSRELDAEIAKNVGTFREKPPTSHDENFWIPHYTTSLDAALTLVPEGWAWTTGRDYHAPGGAHAEIAEPIMTKFGEGVGVRAQVFKQRTPALALCIAALKARTAP